MDGNTTQDQEVAPGGRGRGRGRGRNRRKRGKKQPTGAVAGQQGGAAPGGRANGAEPPIDDFEALLEDVVGNPDLLIARNASGDHVLDEKTVMALQKRMNPYAYVVGGLEKEGVTRSAAISCTNLRMEYAQRFAMTGIIGYLFRMYDEWEVPEEQRRWSPKKAAKRAAAKAPPTAWTPEELVARTGALSELARLALAAETDAEGARLAAADAERAALEASLTGEAGPAESKVVELLVLADGALAKARGLHYAATFELRKYGLECDRRIDDLGRVASQHPSVREVIAQDPIIRPVPGEQTIPAGPAKEIVGNFLRNWFEYNPDAHVRGAYDEAVIRADTAEVEVPGLPGTVLGDTADPSRLTVETLRASPPTAASAADRRLLETLTATPASRRAATAVLRNDALADALAEIYVDEAAERFRRYLFPIGKDSPARPAIDIIPPQDTFHRLGYYLEVNFEELRTATEAVYHERPDLDMALIIYDGFSGGSDAVGRAFEEFKDAHQDEVISEIKHVDFGKWCLLGDFKENRKKIEFLNKNTGVLKRILDRHREDKKLGGDLMRNRVREVKSKNIRESGPDAPGLEDYRARQADSGHALAGMGVERVIGREEMKRLERARGDRKAAMELEVIDASEKTIADLTAVAKLRELTTQEGRRLADAQKDLVAAREMIEVPDEAIQVDVWTHDTEKGVLEKSRFYSKAEAPEDPRKLADQQGGGPLLDAFARPLAPYAHADLSSSLVREREATQRRVDDAMLAAEKTEEEE